MDFVLVRRRKLASESESLTVTNDGFASALKAQEKRLSCFCTCALSGDREGQRERHFTVATGSESAGRHTLAAPPSPCTSLVQKKKSRHLRAVLRVVLLLC